jgi:hypothetical protein
MKSRKRTILVFVLVGAAALLVASLGYTVGQGRNSVTAPGIGSLGAPVAEYAAQQPAVDSTSKQGYGLGTGETSGDALRDGASAEGAPSVPGTDRLVIRTATMEVRVKKVDSALEGLRAAARRNGAEISDLSVFAGEPQVLDSGLASQNNGPRGPASASVTLRVPAQKLDALQAQVAKLGVVLTQSANANDVTEQAIDMEARLRNMRAEEARLRSFLKKTTDVSELLEVERELSRVRGEIESMDAQLTYLQRQAARSTLTVALSEPGPVVQPAGPTWGLREAVTRGIQAAAAMVTTLVTLAIPLTLLAVLIGIVVWPISAILKRRAARRSAQLPAGATPDEHGEAE